MIKKSDAYYLVIYVKLIKICLKIMFNIYNYT